VQIGVSGIMDQDHKNNPDFHDASYAYLPYCSSDTSRLIVRHRLTRSDGHSAAVASSLP